MSLKSFLQHLSIPPAPESKAPTRHLVNDVARRHAAGGGKILDLGCGARKLSGCIARMDYVWTPGQNLRGDAHNLPFADSTFSLVICTAVLEHVADYRRAIAEIVRVVKPGGEVWIEIPWLFPAHPGDSEQKADYVRLSASAYAREFAPFEMISFGSALGVGSALATILPEYFALFFSLRNHTIFYDNVRNLCTWLFFPLRWTDRILMGRRWHERIAGGFFFHGRKR